MKIYVALMSAAVMAFPETCIY